MALAPEEILDFWLRDVGRDRWFADDTSVDSTMRDRFLSAHEQAANNDLSAWEKTPESMLALILLLHEFPRRMFRGTPRAFATDDLALELARTAIINHFDDRIDKTYKLIFYLPFLNSENVNDQRLAIFYIRERTKENEWLTLAEENLDAVERFGRFPDRNAILGRESTPEEVEYMKKTAKA